MISDLADYLTLLCTYVYFQYNTLWQAKQTNNLINVFFRASNNEIILLIHDTELLYEKLMYKRYT